MSSALRQTKACPVGTASFLKLNVDWIWNLVIRGNADSYSISPKPAAEGVEQTAQLLLKSLVKVEIDKRVVDVGAFGKKGRIDKALRSHVRAVLMENEEKGHYSIGGPGDHKAQTDAKEHLREEITELQMSAGNTM